MSVPNGVRWDAPDVCWDAPGAFWDAAPPPPPRRSKSMTAIPVVRVVGFAEGMTDLLNSLKTRMVAASSDPTAEITSLTADTPVLNNLNTQQEDLKQELHTKTAAVEAKRDDVYALANRGGDKIIGCFGKNSPEAKLVANLRASIRVEGRPGTPPANPTPPSG